MIRTIQRDSAGGGAAVQCDLDMSEIVRRLPLPDDPACAVTLYRLMSGVGVAP